MDLIFCCASHINTLDRIRCLERTIVEHNRYALMCIGISYDVEYEKIVLECAKRYHQCIFVIQPRKCSQFEHYLFIAWHLQELGKNKKNTWISFFDDDDKWPTHRVEHYNRLTKNALQNNFEIAFPNGYTLYDVKEPKRERKIMWTERLGDVLRNNECVLQKSNEYYMFCCTLGVLLRFVERLHNKDELRGLLKYLGCDLIFRNFLAYNPCYVEKYVGPVLYVYKTNMDMHSSLMQLFINGRSGETKGWWEMIKNEFSIVHPTEGIFEKVEPSS